VPLVLLEEVEDLLEGGVRNPDFFAMQFLNLVALEDAAVQIRHLAQQLVGGGGSVLGFSGEALEEQGAEEAGVEPVFALPLHPRELVPQVVGVAVEESFFLDEIDEHETVEHHGGVPTVHPFVGDAFDELEESRMLRLEPVVEAFGDALDIEAGTNAAGDIHNHEAFLVFEGKRQRLQLLNQGIAGLAAVIRVFAAGEGFAGFAFDPLPDLPRVLRVRENQQVLMDAPGDLALDPAAGRVVRQRAFTSKSHHAAFVRNGGQHEVGLGRYIVTHPPRGCEW